MASKRKCCLFSEVGAIQANCTCIETCLRTLYEPSITSVGLKSLSLHNPLTSSVEAFSNKILRVKNLRIRVKGDYFEKIISSFTRVMDGYYLFLDNTTTITEEFIENVAPVQVLARKVFDQVVSHDIYTVLFGGLLEAQEVVNTLMSPLKTSLLNLLERINVRTNILVMLVWQGLEMQDFSHNAKINEITEEVHKLLDDINNGMIIFPLLAYNVSMLADTGPYTFFPTSIVEECQEKFYTYLNVSAKLKVDISLMNHLMKTAAHNVSMSKSDVLEASLKVIRSISKFQKFYKDFMVNCLEIFDMQVEEYIKKKENIDQEVKQRLNSISVSFDWFAEIGYIRKDYESMTDYAKAFETLGKVTAYELATNFGPDKTTGMMGSINAFVDQAKFQTSSILKSALLDYQKTLTSAYIEGLSELCKYTEFTSEAFVKSRISSLTIL